MRQTLPTLLLLALSCASACGDDDAPAPAMDLGFDANLMVPPGSCSQIGQVGNENGVGTFCTPTGRECSPFPLAGICLARVAPAEEQWFCTRLCERDDQCGADARCFGDTRGMSCVPSRCLDPEVDAGADDAGTDDAGADDAGADDAGADDAGADDAGADDAG